MTTAINAAIGRAGRRSPRCTSTSNLPFGQLHARQPKITIMPDFRVRVSAKLRAYEDDAFIRSSLLRFDGCLIAMPNRFAPSVAFRRTTIGDSALPDDPPSVDGRASRGRDIPGGSLRARLPGPLVWRRRVDAEPPDLAMIAAVRPLEDAPHERAATSPPPSTAPAVAPEPAPVSVPESTPATSPPPVASSATRREGRPRRPPEPVRRRVRLAAPGRYRPHAAVYFLGGGGGGFTIARPASSSLLVATRTPTIRTLMPMV